LQQCPSRRAFLGALSLLLLPASARSGGQAQANLRLLTHDSGEATRRILEAFKHHFPGAIAGSDPEALTNAPGGVLVTIGPASLKAALAANLGRPLVSLFTSHETYTRLVDQAPKGRSRPLITGIFAEASPADQMRLIRQLYGQPVLVGALLSPGTAHLEPEITSAARAADLDVLIQMVGPEDTAARSLARLSGIRVLLAIPDQALYTSETLRAVLETGYRHNVATVGFSPALVSAGAIAAAYASIDDVVLHFRLWIDALAAGRVPKAQYPVYWRVIVNDRVATSLNVPIADSVRALGHLPDAPN
jgi:putative tryptophan/tyrosine transport system substrate-binding protein